ncbi:MAG TPA: SRPBCC domain-containing protein [Candidatus Saccharimonadales bacterium]|jgi:uncharacterized protein YndB with AHSA1/START domain|nr:SRPBCC domain-containing protein [Candidatus Saccharimonadales bacterium]
MAESKELTLTRVFDAPRELVFKAWTDAEMLAKWWGPRGVTSPELEIDLRPGGTIRIVMLAGDELGELAGQRWPMQGTFKEIKAPEKLVFINQAVDEEGNVLIDGLTTVTFEEQGGKTKLTMHAVAKPVATPAEQMLEGMTQGWSQSLDKLAELVNQ